MKDKTRRFIVTIIAGFFLIGAYRFYHTYNNDLMYVCIGIGFPLLLYGLSWKD